MRRRERETARKPTHSISTVVAQLRIRSNKRVGPVVLHCGSAFTVVRELASQPRVYLYRGGAFTAIIGSASQPSVNLYLSGAFAVVDESTILLTVDR